MSDRYWEGHRDGGADMRERFEDSMRRQRERADANWELAQRLDKLARRLWIQINGDDVFFEDALQAESKGDTG